MKVTRTESGGRSSAIDADSYTAPLQGVIHVSAEGAITAKAGVT